MSAPVTPSETAAAAVTIATRTYERPLLLERTIEDVLAQTFGAWHLSIANNGGDPGVVDAIVEKHRDSLAGRVTVTHMPESAGMQKPANLAVEAPPPSGRGRYVTIHDDDDTWSPNFLERMVAWLDEAGDDVDGVACRCDYVEERISAGGIEELLRRPHNPNMTFVSLADILVDCPFPPIAFLYRRSAHDRLGGYREGTLVADDWDFLIRLLRDGKVEVIKETLADYRHRAAEPGDPYANSVQQVERMSEARQAIRDRLVRESFDRGELDYGHLAAGITPVDRDTLELAKELRQRVYDLQLLAGDIDFKLRQVSDLAERSEAALRRIERDVTPARKLQNLLSRLRHPLRRD